MSKTTNLSSFVGKVVARLQGENTEVLGEKIKKKASSSINGQIHALDAKIVDLEETIEEKEEALDNAIYPVVQITNAEAYSKGILEANYALTDAKEALQELKKDRDYLKSVLTEKIEA